MPPEGAPGRALFRCRNNGMNLIRNGSDRGTPEHRTRDDSVGDGSAGAFEMRHPRVGAPGESGCRFADGEMTERVVARLDCRRGPSLQHSMNGSRRVRPGARLAVPPLMQIEKIMRNDGPNFP